MMYAQVTPVTRHTAYVYASASTTQLRTSYDQGEESILYSRSTDGWLGRFRSGSATPNNTVERTESRSLSGDESGPTIDPLRCL